MSGAPRLSVVVPVYRGDDALRRCLEALRSSEGLAHGALEVVVTLDGRDDACQAVARRLADRVVEVEGGPRGPADARNRGAAVARGDVLVFVDADVLVHPDALRRVLAAMDRDPGVVAVFGAYDDAPEDPGFLSQYRNLFHRYNHLKGAGEAETFWAGCGAVRAAAFRQAGGFDAAAFPRPQIEDIELGYRLRARGGRILLDPSIQGKHLKGWTLGRMIRTDLLDRGVPWVRLLVRRGRSGIRDRTLNVTPWEKVKTGSLGLALVLGAAGPVLGTSRLTGAAGALLAALVLANWPTYAWFARARGWPFALGVVPMNLLYYLVSGSSVVLGWTAETLARGARRSP